MDDADPMLDALVVAEIRSGNRQAYGMLIDRYQVRLRAALYQRADEGPLKFRRRMSEMCRG